MIRRLAFASTYARIAAAAALAAVAAMAAIGGTAAARPLVLEDLYRVREVADPQLSPDGRRVAYTVSAIDREQDETVSDIWMTSWDGGQTVQLTSTPASETAPRFSPDGRYLAFLSDRGDPEQGAQVWLLDLNGGEAQQASHLAHAVTDYAWSPDGRRMVLVVELTPPPAADEKPTPIVIDRYRFKEDETGYLGEAREHLYLLDIESGEAAALTDGPYDNRQPSWSPDGATIAFVSKRGDDPDRHDDWDVYVREARPGAPETRLPTGPGADDSRWSDAPPRYSPDGTRIAYERGGDPADIWYALEQVGIATLTDGNVELPAAALDRNTTNPRWSADGRRLYFLLEDNLGVQLAELRLRDGRIRRLTGGDAVVFDYDVGRDGRIVVLAGTAAQPAEVFRLDGERLLPLSRQNDAWLDEVDLRPAGEIAFDSADGRRIHGLKIAPSGGGPFPLILKLHGGPVAQYQHEFDFEWQLYAAHGYLVAGVNPRGSSGRGHEFQKLLFGDWGYADVPDILAAADHLVESGAADPERLGVGGWSYGGILTNYVIASTDRFRAAVSGSGMSNMLGGYGIDQYVRDWEAELGKPWENTDAWLRLSYPFLHADRITTPTLFLCGADDFNVPLAATEQMYQALRSLDVPTRLVIYPGEFHSISRASFRIDRLQRYLDWYGRFLGDGS